MNSRNKKKSVSLCLLSIVILSQFVTTVKAAEIVSSNPLARVNKTKASVKSTPSSSQVEDDDTGKEGSKRTTEKKFITTNETKAKDNESKEPTENPGTKSDIPLPIYAGNWGTCSWTFDIGEGILTIESGELGTSLSSPWEDPNSQLFNELTSIKKIVLNGKIVAPSDSSYLFSIPGDLLGLTQLQEIKGIENLDTSQVTNMDSMFNRCSSLATLELSSFDTSQVTNMGNMFRDCTSLATLDLSSFDTSQVTNMGSMFQNSCSLATLDLRNFDTSQVTNMKDMFSFCSSLATLDLRNFDTSQVTNMQDMFGFCSSLATLDLSSFDTSQVTDMVSMFKDLNLQRLTLSEKFKFLSNASLSFAQSEDGTPTTGNWIKEDGTSKAYSPTEFMANYGTGDLTAGTYVAETPLWGTCPWSFDQETGVLTIKSGTLSTVRSAPWLREDNLKIEASNIKKILFDGKIVAPSKSSFLFSDPSSSSSSKFLVNLTEIEGLKNLDTSQVTDMSSMFDNCSSLATLDLSSFDTSQVTSMFGMFVDCSSLATLDVSSFDTSQVTSMNDMFCNCSSLATLDLSSFDTSKVISMFGMFQVCSSLATLDLSSFDTSKVTDMRYIFYNINLQRLTLSEKFKFLSDASLGFAQSEDGTPTTGNWIKEDGTSKAYSPTEFMANYGTGDLTAGTYVAETPLWGTCPWTFDQETGVLTIKSGTLSTVESAPWLRGDSFKIKASNIKKILFDGKIVAPSDSSFLFSNPALDDYLSNLQEIKGIENLDTSQVTDMSGMFQSCSSLATLDLSSFDTSQVIEITGMFQSCSSLATLDLSSFDTSQVTDISTMFFGCKSLATLELSSFDTSQVTNMYGVFDGCISLATLDVSSFDTSQVTDMYGMFADCKSLATLDLSSFDTSQVIGMIQMFRGVNLQRLTLSEKFKFLSDADLGFAQSEDGTATTGNWIKEDGTSKAYSPTEFMANYGIGDLTAGTYVAETQPASLQMITQFDKEEYTIGDQIKSELLINCTDDSPEGTVAKNIKLTNLNDFTLGGAQELPEKIKIELYDNQDKLIESKDEIISPEVDLPDIKKGEYIHVTLIGKACNNTDDSQQENYTFGLENNNKPIQEYTGKVIVHSGSLEFKSIPKKLEFNSEALNSQIENTLISRKVADWNIEVSDLRGTIPHGEEKEIDRQNWKMYVTAKEFKDSSGKAIPYDTLSTIFTKDGVNKELNSEETMVENHNVLDETPEKNNLFSLNWDQAEGINAIVHKSSQLSHDVDYNADMTFELRIEP